MLVTVACGMEGWLKGTELFGYALVVAICGYYCKYEDGGGIVTPEP